MTVTNSQAQCGTLSVVSVTPLWWASGGASVQVCVLSHDVWWSIVTECSQGCMKRSGRVKTVMLTRSNTLLYQSLSVYTMTPGSFTWVAPTKCQLGWLWLILSWSSTSVSLSQFSVTFMRKKPLSLILALIACKCKIKSQFSPTDEGCLIDLHMQEIRNTLPGLNAEMAITLSKAIVQVMKWSKQFSFDLEY